MREEITKSSRKHLPVSDENTNIRNSATKESSCLQKISQKIRGNSWNVEITFCKRTPQHHSIVVLGRNLDSAMQKATCFSFQGTMQWLIPDEEPASNLEHYLRKLLSMFCCFREMILIVFLSSIASGKWISLFSEVHWYRKTDVSKWHCA